MIRAVVFDAFGTLVQITNKLRPYGQMTSYLASHCDRPARGPEDALQIMTHDVGLVGALNLFQPVHAPLYKMMLWERDLHQELASIRLFDEVREVMQELEVRELFTGICSNLAAPYAVPIKLLLPNAFQSYSWSFEVRAAKPNPIMYQHVIEQLQFASSRNPIKPEEILFVGDTLEADVIGPRKAGMHSVLIDRSETKNDAIHSLLQIFPIIDGINIWGHKPTIE